MHPCDFDAWTATESHARQRTLAMGYPQLHVHMVQGRGSRLGLRLLPVGSPLRRWCVATLVQDLMAAGRPSWSPVKLREAMALCCQEGLVPPPALVFAFSALATGPDAGVADPGEALRTRRRQRTAWCIKRRFTWAHPHKPERELWHAAIRGGEGADKLGPELAHAIRQFGAGKGALRQLATEAEALLGPPTWPAHAGPPPLSP